MNRNHGPDSDGGTGILPARNAVGVVFVLNGLLFASLVSRVPDLRSGLDLDNAGLGLLLLAIAAGSLVALPLTGALIERFSAAAVVRGGAVACVVGLALAATGASVLNEVAVTAPGLLVYGLGVGSWDVAMNVEGADVERLMGRTVMPRFHAGFSLGTILGAGAGVVANAVDLPMTVHLVLLPVVALTIAWVAVRSFLPVEPAADGGDAAPASGAARAWLEPRTLAVGVMVLCFATVEGTANDWLSLALIDGYDVPDWVGVGGFAVFVTAMTAGRLLGPPLLDRFGRAPTLWATSVVAGVGILLVVLGGVLPLVVLGIGCWGLGAALGFPVGMSAAADDPARSAARVAVVSTIGYGAFLAGPPLLGYLGDAVGTLPSLLAVAALMVPAALSVASVRPPRAPGVEPADR